MKEGGRQVRDENIKLVSVKGAEPVEARFGLEAASRPGFERFQIFGRDMHISTRR